jgi:ABC-type Mn2+/Zn2+ transport system permease subunit
MILRHELYVIAGVGAVIAFALFLFPGWNAVHPTDSLSMSLGHAWILSPPSPPEHFGGLLIERDWSDNILGAIGALTVGAFWIALSPRKTKQSRLPDRMCSRRGVDSRQGGS